MAAATKRRAARRPKNPWLIVRNSKVHGYGAFARRFIPKGTRVIEYLGERISHKEADRRYEDADPNDNHTFLFIADRRTVIDATYGGNEARFINHSCEGNCTSETEKGRVFIEATRDIARGEELGYDYQIPRDKDDPANVDKVYACRCGSPRCRGSMLWPPKRKRRKAVKQGGRQTLKQTTRQTMKQTTRQAVKQTAGKSAARPRKKSKRSR